MPTRDHEDFAGLHDLVMAVGGHHPGMLSWSSDSVTTRVTARPISGIATAISKRESLDVQSSIGFTY